MPSFPSSPSCNKRRRANFEAVKKNGQVYLGFKRYNSHQIINIDHCLLLLPEINKLIFPLKAILLELLDEKQKVNIYLTVAHNGIDLLIESESYIPLTSKMIDGLNVLSAQDYGIIKLSLNSPNLEKIIFQSSVPYIILDGVQVEVNANCFMQSSHESDDILQKLVLDFLPTDNNAKEKVVDLFCGRGTFTIPLSKKYRVDGFEFDKEALVALGSAISKTDLPIKLERRDLEGLPLRKSELNKYIFAVINPPRLGALEQVAELSRSLIKRVCYVSCNPTTFARDAKVLVNGGYELLEVTPVDQFYWSAHIEMVGYFQRK